jgi:hypothetical protein
MKKTSCVFTGRLGNNLFQLANLISYSLRHNREFVIEIDSVFWVNGVMSKYKVPLEIFDYNYEKHLNCDNARFFLYNPGVFNFKKHPFWLRFFNVRFNGHYLSYKYFDEFKHLLIDKYFKPNESIRNQLNLFNPTVNSVAISVRRGDFLKLQDLHTVLDVEYYDRALSYLNEKLIIDKIYVFSDDLNWCRCNFQGEKYSFVEEDFIIQFFKLSKLNHVILSNSSFAWWGAYLNKDVQNVIFPMNWFGPKNASKFSLDLFPVDWKGIK